MSVIDSKDERGLREKTDIYFSHPAREYLPFWLIT